VLQVFCSVGAKRKGHTNKEFTENKLNTNKRLCSREKGIQRMFVFARGGGDKVHPSHEKCILLESKNQREGLGNMYSAFITGKKNSHPRKKKELKKERTIFWPVPIPKNVGGHRFGWLHVPRCKI